MKAKDRLQGYFLAGGIGFAVGVLLVVYTFPELSVPSFFNNLMIFTIIIAAIILGSYEVLYAITHQGE